VLFKHGVEREVIEVRVAVSVLHAFSMPNARRPRSTANQLTAVMSSNARVQVPRVAK